MTAPATRPAPDPTRARTVAVDLAMLLALLALSRVVIDFGYGALATWRPGTDSGIFLGTAMHLLQGRWLYAEIFDNKPPPVYLINAAVPHLGQGDWRAIRPFQVLVFAASAWLVYRIALDAGVRRALAQLTKEPFALSVLPWLASGLLVPAWRRQWPAAMAVAAVFVLPLATWLLVFAAAGRFGYWLDYLSFNFG